MVGNEKSIDLVKKSKISMLINILQEQLLSIHNMIVEIN